MGKAVLGPKLGLPVFSKVRWGDVPALVIQDWFGKGLMLVFGNGGNITFRAAVQELVIGRTFYPKRERKGVNLTQRLVDKAKSLM